MGRNSRQKNAAIIDIVNGRPLRSPTAQKMPNGNPPTYITCTCPLASCTIHGVKSPPPKPPKKKPSRPAVAPSEAGDTCTTGKPHEFTTLDGRMLVCRDCGIGRPTEAGKVPLPPPEKSSPPTALRRLASRTALDSAVIDLTEALAKNNTPEATLFMLRQRVAFHADEWEDTEPPYILRGEGT